MDRKQKDHPDPDFELVDERNALVIPDSVSRSRRRQLQDKYESRVLRSRQKIVYFTQRIGKEGNCCFLSDQFHLLHMKGYWVSDDSDANAGRKLTTFTQEGDLQSSRGHLLRRHYEDEETSPFWTVRSLAI